MGFRKGLQVKRVKSVTTAGLLIPHGGGGLSLSQSLNKVITYWHIAGNAGNLSLCMIPEEFPRSLLRVLRIIDLLLQ